MRQIYTSEKNLTSVGSDVHGEQRGKEHDAESKFSAREASLDFLTNSFWHNFHVFL